jgi:hypothetical protein
VATWHDIKFAKPIVGWRELAAYFASKTGLPHRSPDSLRLAFWAGRFALNAVRYGQKIVFDRKSVDTLIQSGRLPTKRRGAA